jgi:hypothetical protein
VGFWRLIDFNSGIDDAGKISAKVLNQDIFETSSQERTSLLALKIHLFLTLRASRISYIIRKLFNCQFMLMNINVNTTIMILILIRK